MVGTRFSIEVQPKLPPRLARLRELAEDLFYSWDRQVRGLFWRLDNQLWESSGHNPKLFLRRVSQHRLEEAANDRVFLEDLNRTLSAYDTYHQEKLRTGIEEYLDPETDLVAYFCAEFGFHESLPIYSGGLGILANTTVEHSLLCQAGATVVGMCTLTVGSTSAPGSVSVNSGAGFGAISFAYYGQFPDIHGIALAALYLKIACAVGGIALAVLFLRYQAAWPSPRSAAVWRGLLVLGVTALAAAAFLRWFS